MKILIREAKIIDSKSPFHQQIVDVKISDGLIEKIGKNLAKDSLYKEISQANLHLSQGWMDSSVSLGEPGYEDRETISNGLQVAAKSGFTAIALQPNSFPVIDNQSQIHFVKQKAAQSATDLFPIGALTKNCEGTDLAELFDMKNAGAVAFGDYGQSLANANLLKIGLQYVQDFDGLVIAFCQDEKIKGSGIVNEGVVSTRLGLKGIPNLAEELIVARNLFLLEYTGGKLHLPTISTAKSVDLIREAKAKGLQVTCSVAVSNLVLTDEKLDGFDTRFKLSPPLRTNEDRMALLAGVADNTIDIITLESAFGALLTVLPVETIVAKLTYAKSIFSIESSEIAEGKPANVTLFSNDGEWIFTKDAILSKSKNSAFLGTKMKGKVIGIYNKNTFIES